MNLDRGCTVSSRLALFTQQYNTIQYNIVVGAVVAAAVAAVVAAAACCLYVVYDHKNSWLRRKYYSKGDARTFGTYQSESTRTDDSSVTGLQ